jgi:ParB family chromosome partitioning protein
LDKLVRIFELSERFENLREPGAAITWARELMGVSKALLTPSVIDAVVEKVGQKKITNSKDLRKLRPILRDPVAKEHFLGTDGAIDSAMLRIAPAKTETGLLKQLDATVAAIRELPWTQIDDLRSDQNVLERIDEAQALLASLRRSLSDRGSSE